MIEKLHKIFLNLLEETPMFFTRYLYDQINWDNRLIMIKGPKGVGKTTMLLQHIRMTFPDPRKVLYASADNSFFATHTIIEVAEYMTQHGMTHLFLDEVHKYNDWDRQLKEVYDCFPRLKVVVTGSSMLKLEESEADLGRRCRQYSMNGLSFREYLKLEGVCDWQPLDLETILTQHELIAVQHTKKLPVLGHFEKYLTCGYYPFYREEGDGFAERLETVIDTIVRAEIPSVEKSIEYESVYKTKVLLGVLAEQNPYTLNIKEICALLGCSREILYKMLDLLQRSGLIRRLYGENGGLKRMEKPEKILFDNTCVMYALADVVDKGTMRETFFANMLAANHKISMPQKGDLLVDGKYLFEVGGRNKGYRQIANIDNSYVVSDNIDLGFENKIPLWIFGMLY